MLPILVHALECTMHCPYFSVCDLAMYAGSMRHTSWHVLNCAICVSVSVSVYVSLCACVSVSVSIYCYALQLVVRPHVPLQWHEF